MRSERTKQMFTSDGPVVIPFLTAGYPDRRTFLAAALAAHDAGAAALEVGMPFSDPLADGPAIQRSSEAALANGVTLRVVLELTSTLRARMPIPIFLMGYLNPVMKMGMERFARSAQQAGVDGTIIPDCPIEEAAVWMDTSRRHQLENVFLIAPTSADDRIRRIDRLSSGFSYCVSVTGVTGTRKGFADGTKSYLQRVRRLVKQPTVVGFGIASPAHVSALKGLTNGFVVGSALVPLLGNGSRHHAPHRVASFVASLVKAAE